MDAVTEHGHSRPASRPPRSGSASGSSTGGGWIGSQLGSPQRCSAPTPGQAVDLVLTAKAGLAGERPLRPAYLQNAAAEVLLESIERVRYAAGVLGA
jgi:hypothetical protein